MSTYPSKKKILFLITKSNWGGAQRHVFDLATSLPTDRFTVTVVLGGNGKLKEMLAAAKVRVLPIESLQRDISVSKEIATLRELWQILKREQPDILHVHSSKAGGLGALIGRLHRVPKVIYSAHGWAFNENRGVLAKLLIGFFHWLTVMFAHVTIAVSSAIKAQMQWPLAQRKITVIQNGRAPTVFLNRPDARAFCVQNCPRLAPYTSDTWTGTIGELHSVKGHDISIEVMAKLVAAGTTSVRHLIIGDGDERLTLEKKIFDHNLEDHVFLIGHVHEAATLLQALDIFILPSRSEAIGYVVIEAAQAGLPIIASRVGGVPEVISDGWDGVLVPSEDVDTLVTTLGNLLEDEQMQRSLGAAAKVRGQHFSKDRMLTETTALYNL